MRYHGFWNYLQQQYYHQRELQLQASRSYNTNNNMDTTGATTITKTGMSWWSTWIINPFISRGVRRNPSSSPLDPFTKQQQLSTRSGDGGGGGGVANNNNVVKIPFLITSSMKDALGKERGLGYTVDQIKKMTPLKATLLLQHQVDPKEMENRLPQIILDHEKLVEEQQQAQQRELLLVVEQQKKQQQEAETPETLLLNNNVKNNNNNDDGMGDNSPVTSSVPANVQEGSVVSSSSSPSSSSSSSSSSASSSSSSNRIVWYRVVEVTEHIGEAKDQDGSQNKLNTNNNNNNNNIQEDSIVMGLHKTLEEAQQDCKLRQELANRNDRDYTGNERSRRRYYKVMSPMVQEKEENDEQDHPKTY